MPVRGARVRRSKWFHEIVQAIEAHGFHRGASGIPPCPGRYFYSRDAYTIQLLPDRTIRITRPNGMVEVVSARSMRKVDFILAAIVRFIDLPRTA